MPDPRYRTYVQSRKAIDQFYHQEAARRELPDSVLWLALYICEQESPCTPTELYTDCAISKQTGHSALMQLEKRGLIQLVPDPADRRSKRVEWMEQGRAFAQSQLHPLLAAEEAAFESLAAGEQELLITLTQKLYSALKTKAGNTGPGKGIL